MSRDAARAAAEIEEVERIAREGLAEVRTAITGYRSSGVQAEMAHVRKALSDAGIDATVEAHPVTLDPAQDTALSLALREAATNVIRHAAATRCHIRFYAQDGSVLHGSGRQRPRRRRPVRPRPDRHARAHPGAGRRPAARHRSARGTTLPIVIDCRMAPRAATRWRRNLSTALRRLLIACRSKSSSPKTRAWCWAPSPRCSTSSPTSTSSARARDGKEALALAAQTDPDVVLTDIEMPAMTGLELAAELRGAQGPAPARHHPDDVRAARLPAPRPRCRRLGLPAEGRARREARRRHPRRAPGAARHRPAAGPGCVGRGRSAHRSRAADPARRRGGPDQRRHRRRLHLSEGTVRNYLSEAICKLGRHQPHRGGTPGAAARLALTDESPFATDQVLGRLRLVVQLSGHGRFWIPP